MFVLMGLIGLALIIVVLWDVFETIVLPRRVTRRFRLTRFFYRSVWAPWSAIARKIHKSKRRETFLSIFGPLSLLMLLSLWAVTLVFGFALLHWAFRSHINTANGAAGFFTYLYYSGTTFFTLGLGDVAPIDPAARMMTVIEASLGLGLLALVICLYRDGCPKRVSATIGKPARGKTLPRLPINLSASACSTCPLRKHTLRVPPP